MRITNDESGGLKETKEKLRDILDCFVTTESEAVIFFVDIDQ